MNMKKSLASLACLQEQEEEEEAAYLTLRLWAACIKEGGNCDGIACGKGGVFGVRQCHAGRLNDLLALL